MVFINRPSTVLLLPLHAHYHTLIGIMRVTWRDSMDKNASDCSAISRNNKSRVSIKRNLREIHSWELKYHSKELIYHYTQFAQQISRMIIIQFQYFRLTHSSHSDISSHISMYYSNRCIRRMVRVVDRQWAQHTHTRQSTARRTSCPDQPVHKGRQWEGCNAHIYQTTEPTTPIYEESFPIP